MNHGALGRPKPKAVVVGGSIAGVLAGVSCAHALLRTGWEVVVLEKSSGPEVGSLSGAGVALDPLSCKIIESWLGESESLDKATQPFTIDQSQATDGEKVSWTLTRDECYNFRSAHWSDLHTLLCNALPPEIFLWGHMLLSFDDQGSVIVNAKVLQTGKIREITGDLLVAADGSQSVVRRALVPDHTLRFAGYCAWRGVLDFSEDDNSNTIEGIRKAYPDLGNSLYFDHGVHTHCVLYEIPGKRLNWVWYVNQLEPHYMKGASLTMMPNKEAIKTMHSEAEKVWAPELGRVIRETTEPFLNAIYDSDPLEKMIWDNVVLVGDAAHPVTPHSSRSTNAAILDATVLGKCLERHNKLENLQVALSEYQSVRLPVMAKQVLHSRHVGQIRQGLTVTGSAPYVPETVSQDVCCDIRQRNTPFFDHIPDLLGLK